MNFDWISPSILKTKLPFDIFAELSNLSRGDFYVDKLVGVFPGQYELDIKKCPTFETYCLELSDQFFQMRGQLPVFKEIRQSVPYGSKIHLKDLWLNEMYAGSYNKLHRHDGVLSFIIFIDVPYTHEDQVLQEPYMDDPNKVLNGCVEFLDPYSHAFHTLHVHKGIEGTMLLFPSWVYHVVYPFKGIEDPRISMAGNIAFDYNDKNY